MKIGDLVACRFDDSVVMGIFTGRETGGYSEYKFLYVSGKQLVENSLPGSRFIQLQTILNFDGGCRFTNLCDINDWDLVETKNLKDVVKLEKWLTAVAV